MATVLNLHLIFPFYLSALFASWNRRIFFLSSISFCYFQILPNSVTVLLPRQLHSGFVSIAVVEICQQFHETYHETQNTCEYTSCRKNSSFYWLLHPTSLTSYTVTVSRVKFTEFVAKKENMQASSAHLVETRRTWSLLYCS